MQLNLLFLFWIYLCSMGMICNVILYNFIVKFICIDHSLLYLMCVICAVSEGVDVMLLPVLLTEICKEYIICYILCILTLVYLLYSHMHLWL
jgi:hypothetical protein